MTVYKIALRWYLHTWRWGKDGAIAYNLNSLVEQSCNLAYLSPENAQRVSVRFQSCHSKAKGNVRITGRLCKVQATGKNRRQMILLDTNKVNITASPIPLVVCRLKHVTQATLTCDPQSVCTKKPERRGLSQTAMCRASDTLKTPYFKCQSSEEFVPYGVVCDWNADCGDSSDESFCQFPACARNAFACGQGQCISSEQMCDGAVNCKTKLDEQYCDKLDLKKTITCFNVTDPPAMVNMDRQGSFSLIPLPDYTAECPDTHYQCPGNGYCLPVYTRCNGISDCLGHEDEAYCDVYTCEGWYRCRGNGVTICMHVQHLCDGWPQCPQHDDEQMCPVTESCPDRCVCYGTTFTDTVVFQADTFPKLRYLEVIDFSHTQLASLRGELFPNLKILNLRGCPVSDFSPNFMKKMDDLQKMHAGNFKLCCPAVLPDSFLGKCEAPVDEISSCENILKSASYRAALAIFATTALLGNLCSFVYRLWFSSGKLKVGYVVFVLHLSVSDFFMGVYLLIIGLADLSYAGKYLWNESSWKKSITCSIAGLISFLSCEVSSIMIFLITLDRFLVIRFPFSHIRFRTTSAHVTCVVIWVMGLILASIPLLPVTSHWAFYSQIGICIPLPVTRGDFPGRHYSFSVTIVFNMVVFLLIAVGQALIYWSVRANTMSENGSKGKDQDRAAKEATVARRLLIIAMSDFLCWFPIGVCGLLAKLDVPVPGEVNTAMAVFVLPFNSALNPFLYTYTIVQEKRHREREAQLQKYITAQIKTLQAGLGH
ncbi:hypothetical protein ACOMHN_006344 [Nucella lapillus]